MFDDNFQIRLEERIGPMHDEIHAERRDYGLRIGGLIVGEILLLKQVVRDELPIDFSLFYDVARF